MPKYLVLVEDYENGITEYSDVHKPTPWEDSADHITFNNCEGHMIVVRKKAIIKIEPYYGKLKN